MRFIKERGLGNTIIISLCVLAFVINVIMGGGNRFWIFLTGGGNLLDYGQAQYELIFVKHQFWRLVSCGYLHIGILHLCFNLSALWCLGNIVEKRLGTINYLLVYHLSIMISAAVWCMIFRKETMAGASLGIFAVIGIFLIWVRLSKKKLLEYMPVRKRNYVIGYFIISNLISPLTTAVHAISFTLGAGYGLLKKENSL